MSSTTEKKIECREEKKCAHNRKPHSRKRQWGSEGWRVARSSSEAHSTAGTTVNCRALAWKTDEVWLRWGMRIRMQERTGGDAERVSQLLHAPWEHGAQPHTGIPNPEPQRREGEPKSIRWPESVGIQSLWETLHHPRQRDLCVTPQPGKPTPVCVCGRGHAAKLVLAEGQISEPRHEWEGSFSVSVEELWAESWRGWTLSPHLHNSGSYLFCCSPR